MQTFRTVLFWTHLTSGVVAGVVIFIMSFTGAALALQPQILLWAERAQRRVVPPVGAERLPPETILSRVVAKRPDLVATGLTIEHDPTLAAAVTLAMLNVRGTGERGTRPASAGVAPQTTVYVDPYSGHILGQLDPASGARRFFRITTDWHRWLALNGDGRTAGRWITGVSNAAFLVLALTGLYIWIPRVSTWPAFRAVLLFRRGLSGKPRDFNWHNVIGVWSAAVLVVLTFTAMCISFPKTYDVIFAVTGIERPPLPQGPTPGRQAESVVPSFVNLDRAWAMAEARMPSWRSIAVRLPQRADQPVTFTMSERDRLNAMARSTLAVNLATASELRWEPYDGLTVGQRLRTWMRFGHTGELWGLPGQIVAGVASAGGCVLVWTGLSLAWRRFVAWRGRRARQAEELERRERPAA
jgi:uncharacterized iron-regulated membrane protein